MDSYKNWKPLCLKILTVEDEDAFIIGIMIAGFLLIVLLTGRGGLFVYRQTRKTLTAVLALSELPDMAEGSSKETNAQTVTLVEQGRKLDAILEQNRRLAAVFELIGKINNTLEKLEARLGGK